MSAQRKLSPGFATPVRAWLLLLLDGSARACPRSPATLYTYFGAVRPYLESWADAHDHLREITGAQLRTALAPLRGWQYGNAVCALRSLFRFAKKHGYVFADPARGLQARCVEPALVPMTDDEISAVEQIARHPALKLIVALAAVHAGRSSAIRHLKLDDLDLPNRRIIIGGHTQRLAELTYKCAVTWLDHRRSTWPATPNRHLIVSSRTVLGTRPIGEGYIAFHLRRFGVKLDRIRGDRILHEAATVGSDPLHLAAVFHLSLATADRYAAIARRLLEDGTEHR